MRLLEQAIKELNQAMYLSDSDIQETHKCVEQAIEVLEHSLLHMTCQMACDEVLELISDLKDDGDIELVIHELELINSEIY